MINVGIIGAGRSGWELHAQPLQAIPSFHVVAICDITPARLDKVRQAFAVRAYDSASALIADPDVDLIVVSTPNSLHREHTIAALEAGKHVIVEKPMALSVADADAMIAAAERNRRVLLVFHNRHWDRDYQMVRQIIRQGILGELIAVESRVMTYTPDWITYGAPEWNPSWRIQATYGGGMLNDWGSHQLEQILDLCEEWPLHVICHLRHGVWATETDDYFSLKLVMPSGLLVTVEATNDARLPLPRWFVIGREGTLVADGAWGNWTSMHIGRSISGIAMDMQPCDTGTTSSGRSMAVSDALTTEFYNDLAEVLATGRAPTIPVTRGRDAIAIIEAARRSARSGKPESPGAPRGIYKRGGLA